MLSHTAVLNCLLYAITHPLRRWKRCRCVYRGIFLLCHVYTRREKLMLNTENVCVFNMQKQCMRDRLSNHMLSVMVTFQLTGLTGCRLICFKTQKRFWLRFGLNNAVYVAGIRSSALSKAVTYSWTELPFLCRHYVSHFTMLTLYPCGVSIRHSPNSKQASFCGKYQNLILWPVLTFCEKKWLVGTTEYWAFLGLTKECPHVSIFFK